MLAKRRASQRGSVTAEFAVVLPAVTAMLALLLLSVSAGMLQLRLEEGARAGARALARGDSTSQVLGIVARVAGTQTTATLGLNDGYATITVEGRVGGALSGLMPWTQSAHANAKPESAEAAEPTEAAARQQHNPTAGQLRATLWRWARGPGCPLPAGGCISTVNQRMRISHGAS